MSQEGKTIFKAHGHMVGLGTQEHQQGTPCHCHAAASAALRLKTQNYLLLYYFHPFCRAVSESPDPSCMGELACSSASVKSHGASE